MPEGPLPPGAVCRLGSTRFRLPRTIVDLRLTAPGYRTYVVTLNPEGVSTEFDLLTGEPVVAPGPGGVRDGESADGSRILHAYPPRVVEATTGRVFLEVTGDDVESASLSADGRRLAVTRNNPDLGEREADYDLEGRYTRSVSVYDVDRGSLLFNVRPLLNFNAGGRPSPDGAFLVVSGEWQPEEDGQEPPTEEMNFFHVYDGDSGAEIDRPALKPSERFDDLTDDGGCRIVTDAGKVAVYDLGTRKRRKSPGAGRGRAKVAARFDDATGAVVRTDAKTGAVLDETPFPFPAFNRSVCRTVKLYTHPDGNITAVASHGHLVYAWTAPGGERLTRPVGAAMPMARLTFTADGREIRSVCDGEDDVLRRWDAATGELLEERPLPAEVAYCKHVGSFAGADRFLALRNHTALYDLRTGEVALIPREAIGLEPPASFPSAGRLSVTGHRRRHLGFVAFHDNGEPLLYVVQGIAFAATRGDRVYLLREGADGQGRRECLRVEGGAAEEVWSWPDVPGPSAGLKYTLAGDVFSTHRPTVLLLPDGSHLLVASRREPSPRVIDAETGDVVATWKARVHPPFAMHPSRPVVAAASEEGDSVLLCDARTGERLAVVVEACFPHALAWSPDGRRLAVARDDGTALVFVLD